MTVPGLLFVDRIGRRPMFLVGSTFMAIWLFANAGILAAYGTDPGPDGVDGIAEASVKVTGAASKAVIACSYLFVASYAPTWGPTSWIYPSELYPNALRGKAVALATSGNWLFNFALVSIATTKGRISTFQALANLLFRATSFHQRSSTSSGRHTSSLPASVWQ